MVTFLQTPSETDVHTRAAATRATPTWLTRLSWTLVALLVLSTGLGLAVDGLYQDDPAVAEMLRGYDLVTLVLAVPLLALAMRAARRGSATARLLRLGGLGYVVYTYAIVVLGTAFNDAFLLHVAVLVCATYALGAELLRGPGAVQAARPHRAVSALLAFLAVGLGGMWIANALAFALHGTEPPGSGLVETPALTHLGYALDLTLLVPLYAVAAVLLWRGAVWGVALGATALVAGTLQQVAYLVAMPFQVLADVPGAQWLDPAEPVFALAFAVGAAALLRGVPAD